MLTKTEKALYWIESLVDSKGDSEDSEALKVIRKALSGSEKPSHNKSSFQLPSFSEWVSEILKGYSSAGVDMVALEDHYNSMVALVNKKH